ncbi:hypothetical protein PAMP_015731 [Pampus punctatissimus]
MGAGGVRDHWVTEYTCTVPLPLFFSVEIRARHLIRRGCEGRRRSKETGRKGRYYSDSPHNEDKRSSGKVCVGKDKG